MFKNEEIHIFPQAEGEDNILTFNEVDFQMLNTYLPQTPDLLQDPQFCEETMDVQRKYEQPIQLVPDSPLGPPVRVNFAGDVNFTVEIDAVNTKKKKYLYSHRLNRIYVDMGCNFSVGFRWDAEKLCGRDVFVRATTVFAELAQAEKRVERCYQHSHESSNAGTERAVTMNVLRSARALGSAGVYYCGRAERSDSWYSVAVRLDAPADLAYVFACKSSCSSGINRRPINVIFTLEDICGKVYGRQSVGARVCSCPRRDMLRDEEDAEVPRGKRPAAPTAPTAPSGQDKSKKVRLEVVEKDDAVVTLPSIEVVGVRTAILGLEVMVGMMEQTRDARASSQQPIGDINTQINNLKSIIDGLKTQKK
ncbi:cellular tumor antigen p53 [Colias croceus]|uniref:cellular tumor antigen p53 n=1 Tax=Colias crocea TaxID=72248 RepID=UPI001E27FD74|nr:cellular tumor antigen p53 [Colias croceus]